MTDQGMKIRFETAAHDGNLAHWKREVDSRVQEFYDALRQERGEYFSLATADGALVGLITRLGRVDMKAIYGLDGQHVGAWIIFSDQNPDGNADAERHLLSMHLSDRGWVNAAGEGFIDRFGRLSVYEVVTAVVTAQLRGNTQFIESLK